MYFYYLLFVAGLVFYVLALLGSQTSVRECYSDIGNGVMLVTAVLLLIRVAYRVQRAGTTPR